MYVQKSVWVYLQALPWWWEKNVWREVDAEERNKAEDQGTASSPRDPFVLDLLICDIASDGSCSCLGVLWVSRPWGSWAVEYKRPGPPLRATKETRVVRKQMVGKQGY